MAVYKVTVEVEDADEFSAPEPWSEDVVVMADSADDARAAARVAALAKHPYRGDLTVSVTRVQERI